MKKRANSAGAGGPPGKKPGSGKADRRDKFAALSQEPCCRLCGKTSKELVGGVSLLAKREVS